jgi:hypothetical protein
MADHSSHHHGDSHSTGEIKSKTAFVSSFWFVLILVGLFIAALNFIEVMGHSEGHSQGHQNHEATSSQTLKRETGLGREDEDTTQHHSAVPEKTTTGNEAHH